MYCRLLEIYILPEWIYPVAKQTENNKLTNLTININSQHIQLDEGGYTWFAIVALFCDWRYFSPARTCCMPEGDASQSPVPLLNPAPHALNALCFSSSGTSAGFWLGGQCPLAASVEENSLSLQFVLYIFRTHNIQYLLTGSTCRFAKEPRNGKTLGARKKTVYLQWKTCSFHRDVN